MGTNINVGEIYLDIEGEPWVVTSTEEEGHIIGRNGYTFNIYQGDYKTEYFDILHCNKYETWQEAVNSEEFKKPTWDNTCHIDRSKLNVVCKKCSDNETIINCALCGKAICMDCCIHLSDPQSTPICRVCYKVLEPMIKQVDMKSRIELDEAIIARDFYICALKKEIEDLKCKTKNK